MTRALDPDIVPDTKNWTWVLHQPCPECGFDARSVPQEEIPARLTATAAQWRGILAGPGDLRARPAPGVWSPLEYACHVRDVLRLCGERLELMLTQDGAAFTDWDQDATAVTDRYREQDPATVSDELETAAADVATAFRAVTGPQWHRTGDRSDGAHFTVDSFARYFLHDPVHHLHDVTSYLNLR